MGISESSTCFGRPKKDISYIRKSEANGSQSQKEYQNGSQSFQKNDNHSGNYNSNMHDKRASLPPNSSSFYLQNQSQKRGSVSSSVILTGRNSGPRIPEYMDFDELNQIVAGISPMGFSLSPQ
jgi:hypothetical protein